LLSESSHYLLVAMSTYYIDESAGSDDTGAGTIESPFQSLAFALFKAGAAEPKLLARKDANAEYDEPTQSALKKARKNADGLEKKRKKAEELAERASSAQNADRERKEKALEESRKIVLTEDEDLPKATTVRAFVTLPWMQLTVRACRRSYLRLNPSAASVSVYADGSTAFAIRRASCSSFSVMAPGTSSVCFPDSPSASASTLSPFIY
jgi:hypothetical protein